MDGLKVIASGEKVAVVMPGKRKPQDMTFEGIGLEESSNEPVAVLRKGFERITYPLDALRIEPDEDG